MDRGDLVPDPVILGIMKDALQPPPSARGAILDGVVRTVPQAEGLQAALSRAGPTSMTVVLVFAIDDDVLVRRISERTVCDACQTPYTGHQPGTRVREVRRHARAACATMSPTRCGSGSRCTTRRPRR